MIKKLIELGAKRYGDKLFLSDHVATKFFGQELDINRNKLWFDEYENMFMTNKFSIRAHVEILGFKCKQSY